MTKDYQRGDLIPASEAAKLFAARDGRNNDGPRSAIDRARKFIAWAAKTGALPSTDGGAAFVIEKFVGWARSLTRNGESWDDKFKGFPADIEINFTAAYPWPLVTVVDGETVVAAEFSMTRQVGAPDVPAPSEWVAALEHANRRWAETQAEVDKLQANIERIQENAAKYEKIAATNKRSGGMRKRK